MIELHHAREVESASKPFAATVETNVRRFMSSCSD
jgi:hypothetical protein